MSIQFFCSNCGTRITAPENYAGKKVKCPKCQTAMVIPSPRSSLDDIASQIQPNRAGLDEVASAMSVPDPAKPSADALPPPPSEESQWYYVVGGQRLGPVTASVLRRMVESGEIGQAVNVWCQGMPAWLPLASVQEFRSAGSATSPESASQKLPYGKDVASQTVRRNTTVQNTLAWLGKYKTRCGGRSFIFQCILAGWTAFMLFVGFGMMVVSVPKGRNPSDQATMDFTFAGLCCPIGMWLLFAVPLGIAALATLNKAKSEEEK